MKKILTVLGARPQFIKAAVVSQAMRKSGKLSEVLVHTGQHFDANMSDVFFEQLSIQKPDYYLNVNGSDNNRMLAAMLTELSDVVDRERPDALLVYGDTTSTLAGAMTAANNNIALIHVEAGMRISGPPTAEEINRVITDRLAAYLFCSSEQAMLNLQQEGYQARPVHLVFSGDVMLDTLLLCKEKIAKLVLPAYLQSGKPFVLATLHRAETVDNPSQLKEAVEALNELAKNIRVIMPLHPRTAQRLKAANISVQFELIEPLGYLEMMQLLQAAELVITDSGGLQKEAYFSQKNVVLLRPESEWAELTRAGYVHTLHSGFQGLSEAYEATVKRNLPFNEYFYGKGDAAEKIVSYLASHL